MGTRLEDLHDALRRKVLAKIAAEDRLRLAPSNVERGVGFEATKEVGAEALRKKVGLHFHSRRYRSVDPDGFCAKWVIDSLIACGVLRGDGPEDIAGVYFTQERIPRSEREQTVLTISSLPES